MIFPEILTSYEFLWKIISFCKFAGFIASDENNF